MDSHLLAPCSYASEQQIECHSNRTVLAHVVSLTVHGSVQIHRRLVQGQQHVDPAKEERTGCPGATQPAPCRGGDDLSILYELGSFVLGSGSQVDEYCDHVELYSGRA